MVVVWYNHWIEYRICWINYYWNYHGMFEMLEICYSQIQDKETKPGT